MGWNVELITYFVWPIVIGILLGSFLQLHSMCSSGALGGVGLNASGTEDDWLELNPSGTEDGGLTPFSFGWLRSAGTIDIDAIPPPSNPGHLGSFAWRLRYLRAAMVSCRNAPCLGFRAALMFASVVNFVAILTHTISVAHSVGPAPRAQSERGSVQQENSVSFWYILCHVTTHELHVQVGGMRSLGS